MRARSTRRRERGIVAVVVATSALFTACSLDFRPYEPLAVDSGTTRRDGGDVPALPDVGPDDVMFDDTLMCGFVGQMCCAGDSCLVGTCSSGACVPCGASSQPCCAGNVCNSALSCSGAGTCEGCGGPGQVCCASATCNAGAMCSAGMCVGCGAEGQSCCSDGSCAPSFACWNDLDPHGRCTPCGGPGEFCCSTGPACRTGSCTSVAGVSICTVSGNRVLGGSCNVAAQDCPANGVCVSLSGVCFECGRYAEWCCNTPAGCVPNPNFSCRAYSPMLDVCY